MTTTPPQPPQQPYQPEGGSYAPPPPGQIQYPQPGQPQQFPQYGPGQPQGQPPFPQYQQPGQPQFQQPGPGGPQQQYVAPQQPGQFPQGQQFAPGQLQCRFCGGVPAVEATVRGHQGFLIMMRFLKLQGPFCKTCGTAAIRDMTAKSMWQGWWGFASTIINPVTMLTNLGTFSKIKNLPEPAPGAPGRPMDVGKPLFKRPAVLGLLIPFALIAVIVVANLNNDPEAAVGSCVYNKGTASKPNVKVVDCSSTEADYKVIGKIDSTDGDQCAKFEDSTVSYTDRNAKYTLCLSPN